MISGHYLGWADAARKILLGKRNRGGGNSLTPLSLCDLPPQILVTSRYHFLNRRNYSSSVSCTSPLLRPLRAEGVSEKRRFSSSAASTMADVQGYLKDISKAGVELGAFCEGCVQLLSPRLDLREVRVLKEGYPQFVVWLVREIWATYQLKLLNHLEKSKKKELERIRNPFYLPSREEVLNVFELNELDFSNGISSYEHHHKHIKNIISTAKANNGSLKGFSFEEIFQLVAGPSWNINTLSAFCFNEGWYEILTKEMIDHLSQYLSNRCEINDIKNPIVEIGAGDGRLSYFLNQKKLSVPIMPTDSKAWKSTLNTFFDVKKMDSKEAIQTHNPQLIICSWMNPGVDLTKDWRNHPLLNEYVLLGNPLKSGLPWDTYGERPQPEASTYIDLYEGSPIPTTPSPTSSPPFMKDQFTRHQIEEVSRYQISRDHGKNYTGSATWSFRKQSTN